MPNPPLHILGSVSNFVRTAGTSPSEHAHRGGLTFVALDSRAYPSFRGETPSGEWVVARKILGKFPQLDPWPNTGWRFDDEGAARDAYQKMRAHILSKLVGAQPREDRTLERRLNDPSTAWSEAFSFQGQDALLLSCDRTTEARILEMVTDRLASFPVKGSAPPGGQAARLASYSTQVSPHVVAVGMGPQGVAEHVLVAFSPANETALIAGGLAGSECDTKPFALEVPSGILVVAWGRSTARATSAMRKGKTRRRSWPI